ncbi:MAG TPA: phospholipid-binding protein [Coxiellaceae bacterium]|nr:phospholipid-binding protein [Coxiellaceae bacterium]
MKKIPVIILLILTLQGCLPAIFVAGAATGVIIYDHRNAKTMFEDRDITFQIQHRFDNDKELRNKAHLSITTFNHIALLLGQAPNDELRSRAEAIVKSNSKVKMLYNEVTIEKPISDMARANDAWITTKVKTILATVPGLNSSSLKIVTENKVVYLMGLTTRTQAQLATDKTRTVAGVKKVVKLFEYLN